MVVRVTVFSADVARARIANAPAAHEFAVTPRSKAQNAIVRDIRFLGDAVRLVASYYDIAPEAVVEHYPARFDPYGRPTVPGGVFAYQFFDTNGRNCAYWLQDLESVHLFETPPSMGLAESAFGGRQAIRARAGYTG